MLRFQRSLGEQLCSDIPQTWLNSPTGHAGAHATLRQLLEAAVSSNARKRPTAADCLDVLKRNTPDDGWRMLTVGTKTDGHLTGTLPLITVHDQEYTQLRH